MTLTELFVLYKTRLLDKKIVLCHWQDQTGFEINSVNEFETIVHQFGNDEVYLLNEAENEKLYFFEYFIMRQTQPYVVVLRHPLMTNAYWKDLPDSINDMFVSEEGGVYRYLTVDYGKHIKEYAIEFPPDIDTPIMDFCASKMKKAFRTRTNARASNISLLLTNSSRFIDLNPTNFVIYELESIYPEWAIKKITTLALSRKLWNDIKELGKQ
jgi:hypothetical protein